MSDDGITSTWKEQSDARDEEFSLFYRKDLPRLTAFLMIQGANAATASDVAQDAMLKAYQLWDTVDWPRAWVRTTAKRLWWHRREQDIREEPHDPLPEAGAVLAPDEAEAIDSRHLFLEMLHSLTESQREAMAWTYDGYQPTEIAAILGKTPETIRSTLRNARMTLRRLHGPDEVTTP